MDPGADCEECQEEVADLKVVVQDLRAQLVAAERRLRILEGRFREDAPDMNYELCDLLWAMIGQ